MKKKYLYWSLFLTAVLFVLTGCGKSKYVKFEDENMAKVLAYACGEENSEKVTQENLDSIGRINIGLTNNYSTLTDLTKCHNLTMLDIEYPYREQKSINLDYSKYLDVRDVAIESPERVEQIQRELSEIVKSSPYFASISIFTFAENENGELVQYLPLTDLSFLTEASGLQFANIKYQTNVKDYSVLERCDKLAVLYSTGMDIDNSVLKKMSALESLTTDEEHAAALEGLDRVKITVDNVD